MNRRITLKINPSANVDREALRGLVSYIHQELNAEVQVSGNTPDAEYPVLAIFEGDWIDPSLPERTLLHSKMCEMGLAGLPDIPQSSMPSGYGMAFLGSENRRIKITGEPEIRNNASGGVYAEKLIDSDLSRLRVSDDRGEQAPSFGVNIGHLEDSPFEDNQISGFSRGLQVQRAVRSPIRGNRVYGPNIDVPKFETALLQIQEVLRTISDDNERELGELHLQQVARAAERSSPIEGPWSRLIGWAGTVGGVVTSGAILWDAVAALGRAAGLDVPPAPEGLGQ